MKKIKDVEREKKKGLPIPNELDRLKPVFLFHLDLICNALTGIG